MIDNQTSLHSHKWSIDCQTPGAKQMQGCCPLAPNGEAPSWWWWSSNSRQPSWRWWSSSSGPPSWWWWSLSIGPPYCWRWESWWWGWWYLSWKWYHHRHQQFCIGQVSLNIKFWHCSGFCFRYFALGLIGLVLMMPTIVTLLDTPQRQWTRTRPPVDRASLINLVNKMF